MLPEVCFSIQAITFKRVDFPVPFIQIILIIEPLGSEKLMFLRTYVLFPSKLTEILLSDKSGLFIDIC